MDKEGIPTRQSLETLDLGNTSEDCAQRAILANDENMTSGNERTDREKH
jgi:hypothetical protein